MTKKLFATGIRNITMRGMAYFSVKHDELHPFTVNGDIGTIKVLGTHFQFDETTSSNATVYVEQGKVLFSAEDQKQGLVLTKGMKAVLYKGTTKPIFN
jgi:transmembrane sensor